MKKDRVLTPEERRHWRQEVGEEPRPRSSENARSSDVENQGSGTTKLRLNALPPLAVLTGRQAQRALKPFGRAQAVLDLHGVGKLDAYSMVRDFVCTAHAQGGRHLCIITGKGRGGDGVLRASLPHWLNEPALRRMVGGMAQAGPGGGGSGAFHVLLKQG